MTDNVVVCPSCGKKYKKPEKAEKELVKVKCKQCGNAFIIEPASEITENIVHPRSFNDWLIKKSDGNIVRALSYTDIQLLIVKKEVYETDELSQTGSDWKKLSEIDVLNPFFEAVKESEKKEKLKTAEEYLNTENSPVITPAIDESFLDKGKQEISTEEKNAENQFVYNQNEEKTESDNIETTENKIIKEEEKQQQHAKVKKKKKSDSDDDFDSMFTENDEHAETEGKSRKLLIILLIVVLLAGGSFYYFFVFSKNRTEITNEKQIQTENKNVEDPVKQVVPDENNEEPPVPENKESAKSVTSDENKEPVKPEKESYIKEKKEPLKKSPESTVSLKWKSEIKKGWSALDNGNFKIALNYFNSAIKDNPSAADAYFGLGEAYNAAGNIEKAKLNYKKYLSFNPNPQYRKEVENILKNLP